VRSAQVAALSAVQWDVDTSAVNAPAGTPAPYRSFADATRAVLELLERHFEGCAVFLAHLDRAHATHRIVDVRGGAPFGLRSNQATPLDESLCQAMTQELAPRLCNDVRRHPVLGRLRERNQLSVGSYLGVPLELSDGSRVGSLAAYGAKRDRFLPADEDLLSMLARVLGSELERESAARDQRRLEELLRDQARGMGAIGRVTRALADADDARPAVCRAACEIAEAPVAFLLEPVGRAYQSTAVHGAELAPVTIQPREGSDPRRRAFTATETYFVADATNHAALAPPLVAATKARSAAFEPVLRDDVVAGVLIVIWQTPLDALPEATGRLLRLLAAQAAVAIERERLRARVDELALSDELTGLHTRRWWDEELPREIARARRSDAPLCVALLDIDDLGAFNVEKGEREGDRLIKEAASAWRGALRAVDALARLGGGEFGIALPGCPLDEAIDVVNRVREATPRGQKASAGVARWDGEEPVELLTMRCADALASAKSAGGDMTIAAE
jgi:diguanylate cyclase (GGDEF)-like protein